MPKIQYVIESVDQHGIYAVVLFFNPHHSGNEMEETSTGEVVDGDMNGHIRKLVAIPYDGVLVDKAKLASILEDQARGVAERMSKVTNLDTKGVAARPLVGLSSPLPKH